MRPFKLIKHFGLFALILGSSFLCVPSLGNESESQIKPNTAKTNQNKSFVSNALEKSGAAVVTIETRRKLTSRQINIFPPSLFLEPYLERFFDNSNKRSNQFRIQKGQGSGFIFSAEGLVLTNAHVIENADELIIGLSDGRRTKGKVIGKDPFTDLAIIKLNGVGPWPVASIGNSNALIVGDWAIAVGNPYGLEKTVTLGIISNLNRNVSQLGMTHKRIRLIQTDAAINPGNSGGPLLNATGEVIGINTLVRSGPGAGLGFAIPINKAREIASQLITTGRARHPVIGVGLAPSNSSQINDKGALITYVIKGGPGHKGGLKVNDIIIEIGEKKIRQPSDVVNEINKQKANNSLKFKINRNGKIYILSIIPEDIGLINSREN